MGKSSKKYPQYSAGTISINGNSKASTYKTGNNIYSNYNMSDAENKRTIMRKNHSQIPSHQLTSLMTKLKRTYNHN